MEIKVILQQKYDVYPSGKELLLTEKKYRSMSEEGIKMRPMAPEKLTANTGKANPADQVEDK